LFDICRYLFGEVRTVKCEARQSISQSEFDDFAVLLTFESGTIGTFVTSAHAGWSYPFQRLEIYGRYSTIAVEDMEKVIYAPGLKRATEENDFDVALPPPPDVPLPPPPDVGPRGFFVSISPEAMFPGRFSPPLST
jgi:predicted dehydrogenase